MVLGKPKMDQIIKLKVAVATGHRAAKPPTSGHAPQYKCTFIRVYFCVGALHAFQLLIIISS